MDILIRRQGTEDGGRRTVQLPGASRPQILLSSVLCLLSSVLERSEPQRKSQWTFDAGVRFAHPSLCGLHLALADVHDVDVFLTTDDQLHRAAGKLSLNVIVQNPVSWLMETI
jgi:hypothetical protein